MPTRSAAFDVHRDRAGGHRVRDLDHLPDPFNRPGFEGHRLNTKIGELFDECCGLVERRDSS